MNATIVYAFPVFFALIGLEWALDRRRVAAGAPPSYRTADAITSLQLGLWSRLVGMFTRLWRIGVHELLLAALLPWHPESLVAFWSTIPGFILALILYDFLYYWLHRAGHEVGVLWAAHVVHHSSESYNLATALRQSSTMVFAGWLFFIPMAILGVPTRVYLTVALIDLLYQFWVHTEHIRSLGWFDRVFCSPSNHRVHHAVNDRYVDQNYGGILVLWDRLFGTFQEESEPCVYGTRSPLRSWNPLWANAEVYASLLRDARRASSWVDRVRLWLKPPGWRPAEVAVADPKAPFRLDAVVLFDPPVSRAVAFLAWALAIAAFALGSVVLWNADSQPLAVSAVGLAALTGHLVTVGGLLEGKVKPLFAIVVALLAAVAIGGTA